MLKHELPGLGNKKKPKIVHSVLLLLSIGQSL